MGPYVNARPTRRHFASTSCSIPIAVWRTFAVRGSAVGALIGGTGVRREGVARRVLMVVFLGGIPPGPLGGEWEGKPWAREEPRQAARCKRAGPARGPCLTGPARVSVHPTI